MSRRFEVGPILVALGALVLLVSLFLDWYGALTAWEAFEVVEVLLGSLAVAALVIAVGQLMPDLEYVERRWLPLVVLAVAVLVVAEIIDPPPAAGGEDPATGAWLAFGAALVMVAGTVLIVRPRALRRVGRGARDPRARRGRRPPPGHDRDRRGPGGRRGGRDRLMSDVREVSFELERFAWTEPDRLEVTGRWTGLEGRRLGRPVLLLSIGDDQRRLTALPGGHLRGSEAWRAVFSYDGDPAAITGAELEVGRRLVVELPAPPRKRRARPDDTALQEERARREAAEATLAERDAEITGLRDEAETALGDREAQIEELAGEGRGRRDRARRAPAGGRAAADRPRGARGGARRRPGRGRRRRGAHRRRAGGLHRDPREARHRPRGGHGHDGVRVAGDRAPALRSSRPRAPRPSGSSNAERTETARLREELAATGNGEDPDAAAKRMYERVARELESERAAARSLRRELDAVQAQTAEHRRVTSSAAANGLSTSDDAPAAATPAGRLAAARRTEVGRAAAGRRAEAARAASAHRVPTHRSPTAVWVARGVAVAFVVGMLIVMLLIVSALT